jgi:hypothetical protein
MKRRLIGLLGVALFIAGCVLFGMVSQTATYAYVFLGQVGAGTEYTIATPEHPTYHFAHLMGRLWSPDALVYVNLYLSVLAVCVGVTLVFIAIHGLGTRDDTTTSRLSRAGWVTLCISIAVGIVLANAFSVPVRVPPWYPGQYIFALFSPRTWLALLAIGVLIIPVGLSLRSGSGSAGWLALLIALVYGAVLANLSGLVFPPLDPCFGPSDCPPWNPGPFGPPVWTLLYTHPLIVLAFLAMSVLLSLLGFVLARRSRGRLTPLVVRGLQLVPLLAVTILGLAALLLFPLPYSLPYTL